MFEKLINLIFGCNHPERHSLGPPIFDYVQRDTYLAESHDGRSEELHVVDFKP